MQPLALYRTLAQGFVAGEITALAFEERFLDRFGQDRHPHPPADFDALNDLFYEVEAFCADPSLAEPGDVDEPGLLSAARCFLDRTAG